MSDRYSFLKENSNRTFQYVCVSDRYLCEKNDAGKSPLLQRLVECNITMQIRGLDGDTIRKTVLPRTRDSGVGVDHTYIDFTSFISILEQLNNVGVNYREMTLAPLCEYIHKTITLNSEDFFNRKKNLYHKGPIKRLTEIMRVYGISSIKEDVLSYLPSLDRVKLAVLTSGTAHTHQSFSLALPVDRVNGINRLRYQQPIKMFLVVGPLEEVLCGMLGDKFLEKTNTSESCYTSRGGDDVVTDQSYTALIVLEENTATTLKVVEDSIRRCRLFNSHTYPDKVYKEIAAICLGSISPDNSQIHQANGAVKIDNFTLDVEEDWVYQIFSYEMNPHFQHSMYKRGLGNTDEEHLDIYTMVGSAGVDGGNDNDSDVDDNHITNHPSTQSSLHATHDLEQIPNTSYERVAETLPYSTTVVNRKKRKSSPIVDIPTSLIRK